MMIRSISTMMAMTTLLVGGSAVAAPATTVVIDRVEERAVGEPVTVNGVLRARHDILLPAGADGELLWVLDEGTVVREGTVVAKVDAEALELQRNEQELAARRARINVDYLQGEVDRLSRLQESNLAARNQLAEMVSRRDLAANDLSVAQARIAQLDEAIDRTLIEAPVDAVVVEQIRQGGEFARRGDGVIRIVDPNRLEVVITIPVNHANRVHSGQTVTVSTGDVAFEATVKSTIPAGNPASQTFDVLADVPPGLAGLMLSGQFVQVSVPLSESTRALFVPRDAVVLRSEGSYVYRIDENNIANRVEVVLGEGQGDRVAVTGDLRDGDHVAVRGVERLSDGQQVNPSKS